MQDTYCERIAREHSLTQSRVAAVAALLDSGCSVPFIARYRKEATGSLDEVAVVAIRDALERYTELAKRREAIVASLEQRGLLTDSLRTALEQAEDKAHLEDVYLPYKPKRRTRGAMARERGLEPLAKALFAQKGRTANELAAAYVSKDKDVPDCAAALAGARDVIAENICENSKVRKAIRSLYQRRGRFRSRMVKGKEEQGATYRDWFSWDELLRSIPGHRALAMFRGEREGVLSLSLRADEKEALEILFQLLLKRSGGKGSDVAEVEAALRDGYKRLLAPSIENEVRAAVKERADQEAIKVFAANIRELLLAAPLGQLRILALDPGFRTGAKTVALDAQGGLLEYTAVYPAGSEKAREQAARTIRELCRKYDLEAVAVGNGTAGRETEAFVRSLDLGLPVVLVNESGASIYSASEVARREFPDLDLTIRGAVSIGRRLLDPLAELVKIDPKSIGVGQYQHDVDQTALKKALDDVVMHCVNAVGVDVNTASVELLSYVSGVGPVLASNIVSHREGHGPFAEREALKQVKRLGPKAFEQAAGFLRIKGGNPLDASAVHPERYALVRKMASDNACGISELLSDAAIRNRIRPEDYASGEVGLPTLRDILAELAKPGRDPREEFSVFSFAADVTDINDLQPGMRLPGIVTNVTNFGAFVDIGVHRDGLIHISQMAERYVANPSDVVSVGQKVHVTVLDIDLQRKRINLSLRTAPQDT